MGEPKNSHSYDFGISGRDPEPQNQLCLSLETPGYLKQVQENPWNILNNIVLISLKCCEIQNVDNFGKDGRRSTIILKILDVGPTSS